MLESYANAIISNGTHRVEDLACAFYRPIKTLQQEAYIHGNTTCHLEASVVSGDLENICNFYACCSRFNFDIEEPEEFHDAIIGAIYTLNEYAPDGYYFGALEGDGACFGFWKLSDNEYEDSI